MAAGASRRLGRPKQLLDLAGKPVLQHAVDRAAEAAVGDVVVVLGAQAAVIGAAISLPEGGRLVVNERFADGPSTSLRVGLDAMLDDVDRAIVILGDQPGIDPAVIQRVAREPGEIVRAVYDGAPGHPIALHRTVWTLLCAEVSDRGARAVIMRRPERVTEIPIAGPPPRDIDTDVDYETLLATWGRGT